MNPTENYCSVCVVNVRSARSAGDYQPLIVSLPKVIVDAMKVKKGDRLRIYTNGDRDILRYV